MFLTWYMFILIPLTLLLIRVGIKIDGLLKIPKFIPQPYNLLFFTLFILIGSIIVLWSYSYLVIEGQGSPSPYFGRTKRLVKVGAYSLVRHPSIIGKLFGVVSLGFLFQSFSFIFIIVPVLFVGSLIDKIFREEKQLERMWGREYIEYKKSVPMIIPHAKSAVILIILGAILGLSSYHWITTCTDSLEGSCWRLSFSPSAKLMARAWPHIRLGLDNGRLFLSSFAKIIFVEEDVVDSIGFDFDLQKEGSLEVILGEEKNPHYVFKFSRYGNIESGFFRVADGAYYLEDGLISKIFKGDKQYKGRLRINIEDNKFELFINKESFKFSRDPSINIKDLAIASGVESIAVDNIKVILSSDKILYENFESRFKTIGFATMIISLSIFFSVGLWLFYSTIISNLFWQKRDFKADGDNIYSRKTRMAQKLLDFILFIFNKKGLIYLSALFLYGTIMAASLKIVMFDIFSPYLIYLIIPVSLGYSLFLSFLSRVKIKPILKYELFSYLPVVLMFALVPIIKRLFNIELNVIVFLIASMAFYLVLKLIFFTMNAEYFRLYNTLCLVTAILVFVSLELCVRSTYLDRWRPNWKVNLGMSILAADSHLFWSPVTWVYKKKVLFRGKEYPIEKDKGLTRIICLGDSTTWGQGMEDPEETYPRVLEKLLSEERTERRLEVVNAGVQGYSSFQGLLFLKKHLLKMAPDIITVRFCANDIQDNLMIGLNLTDREYWEMLNRNISGFNFFSKLQNIFRKSRLYVGLERLAFSLKVRLRLVHRKPRVPVGEYIKNLESFVKIAEDNNMKILFIYETFARGFPLEMLLEDDPYYQGMKMVAEENGILLIDTVTPFVKRRHENLFWDEVHPTALGHRIIAEEIYKVLKEERLYAT